MHGRWKSRCKMKCLQQAVIEYAIQLMQTAQLSLNLTHINSICGAWYIELDGQFVNWKFIGSPRSRFES